MRGSIAKRSGIVISALAVAAFVSMGVADAVTTSNNVIHGCYAKSDGKVRILRSGQQCNSNEYAVQWNEQGPAGMTGDTGPQGPAGKNGKTGPQGETGKTGP